MNSIGARIAWRPDFDINDNSRDKLGEAIDAAVAKLLAALKYFAEMDMSLLRCTCDEEDGCDFCENRIAARALIAEVEK